MCLIVARTLLPGLFDRVVVCFLVVRELQFPTKGTSNFVFPSFHGKSRNIPNRPDLIRGESIVIETVLLVSAEDVCTVTVSFAHWNVLES